MIPKNTPMRRGWVDPLAGGGGERSLLAITYSDPLEDELKQKSPALTLADYYQQWRQIVESTITTMGQVAYLFDYDFHPIMQLPPIIEAEITDRINEVSEISIKMAILSSTGQLNPIVDILAGNFGVQNAETLELEPETDLPYFVGILSKRYERYYKIEFCTLEGIHQPETLTITATDLLGFLQRLPCPSVPLEWIQWSLDNKDNLILEPNATQAKELLSFPKEGYKKWFSKPAAADSGGIIINQYHQTRIGDRHYRYGEPATIISEMINSSLQAAFHTPPFIAPWDDTPAERRPGTTQGGYIWQQVRFAPGGLVSLFCNPIFGGNEQHIRARNQQLTDAISIEYLTPCYAKHPPIRVKKPTATKNDLLTLAQPQDGYILDEIKPIIAAAGLQISATMWFPGDPMPNLLPYNTTTILWSSTPHYQNQQAFLTYPTIIINLDYITT